MNCQLAFAYAVCAKIKFIFEAFIHWGDLTHHLQPTTREVVSPKNRSEERFKASLDAPTDDTT